jgi:hypothetical protein
MKMSSVLPVLLGSALACLAGTGCTADGSENAAAVAEHVATYEPSGDGGDGALLEGTVLVVDGCLVVKQDVGGRYLPFFPAGEVEWSDGSLRYGGRSYWDGDAIALGGGASGASKPMPASCGELADLTRWMVAQDD